MKSILANTLFVSLFVPLFVPLIVLPVGSVEAQPGPTPEEKKPAEAKPSPEIVAKARNAFLAGKVAHDAKNYTLASKKYTEAYELYPQPLFLYNIAQVKRLGGDKEGALRHYEEYLAVDPKGRGAKNSRQIAGELRKKIAKEKAQADAKAESDAKAKAIAEAKAKADADAKMRAEADAQKKAEADARAAALLNPIGPPPGNPGRGLKIAGLSTAGLGLISLGVSGYFFNSAQSKQDELADFNGIWTAREQKTFDDGESADRLAVISAGVGGAAIVSGALLYWLGSRKRSSAESLVVIPMSVRGSTGIGLRTGF